MRWLLMGLAGLAAGVLSGMGMGGGTVLIPVLTLFFDVGQRGAQGVNMLCFIPAAALALRIHKREGRLDKSTGRPMMLWGLAGAAAGALAAHWTDPEWLRKGFGMLLTGLCALKLMGRDRAGH